MHFADQSQASSLIFKKANPGKGAGQSNSTTEDWGIKLTVEDTSGMSLGDSNG